MGSWPSIRFGDAIQTGQQDSSRRRRDRRELMLTNAGLDAGHQIADLLSQLPPGPIDADAAVFEETNRREPQEGQDAGGIAFSRWTAARGSGCIEHAVTPDYCHVIALALRPTRISLWTPSRQLFEGSLPSGTV